MYWNRYQHNVFMYIIIIYVFMYVLLYVFAYIHTILKRRESCKTRCNIPDRSLPDFESYFLNFFGGPILKFLFYLKEQLYITEFLWIMYDDPETSTKQLLIRCGVCIEIPTLSMFNKTNIYLPNSPRA